jgi:long-chain fatty acid transport protein
MQQYHKYNDAIKWNLDMPQTIQIGIAYRPTDRLEFVADYKWIDWTQIKQLSEKTIKGGLGWEDQYIIKVGASYKLNDRWTVRAGLSHGKSPIPDEFIFANALTPAIGEDNLGLGFTYAVNAHSDLSFAYRHCFEKEREDNGRGDIFSKLGRGSKSNYEENALIFQYGYKW